jgi:hypothetical protein
MYIAAPAQTYLPPIQKKQRHAINRTGNRQRDNVALQYKPNMGQTRNKYPTAHS